MQLCFYFLSVFLGIGSLLADEWEPDFITHGPRQQGTVTCFDSVNFLFQQAPPFIPQRGKAISASLENTAKISLQRFSETLGQDFVFVKKLGHGSFAHVYLAQVRGPGPLAGQVALKMTHSLMEHEQHSIVREFNILTQLDHPNIIKVYRFQNVPIHAFLMEYIDGTSLEEIFDQLRRNKLQLEKSLLEKWQQQLLDLVWYLASNNIAHFDLKPENIIIDSENNVKLIDFNISITDQQRARRLYLEEVKDVRSMFAPFLQLSANLKQLQAIGF